MDKINIKILERNGKFLVGKMEVKRKWIFGKTYKEFICIWKDLYTPAHFKTLEQARNFVNIRTKPDTYHAL
jgi:hypothetical protein